MGTAPQRGPNHRSMSVATVRVKRRTKLALKLREVFDIEDITEVVAGTFWLTYRSVRSLLWSCFRVIVLKPPPSSTYGGWLSV